MMREQIEISAKFYKDKTKIILQDQAKYVFTHVGKFAN
jgi:hypothetical protein